jgi:hypothetical protein
LLGDSERKHCLQVLDSPKSFFLSLDYSLLKLSNLLDGILFSLEQFTSSSLQLSIDEGVDALFQLSLLVTEELGGYALIDFGLEFEQLVLSLLLEFLEGDQIHANDFNFAHELGGCLLQLYRRFALVELFQSTGILWLS